MRELGEVDTKILKELLKDGRKSFNLIAEECHTSKYVVWKHYNEMRKAGIIVGATIQYNFPSFGYQGEATILVNVESQHLNEVFERLRKIPNLITFRLYNSTYNIAIMAVLKTLKDLDNVKELLKKQNSVMASRTYLWTGVRNTPENLSPGCAQK